MVEETWASRDLPVLKAVVELYEATSSSRSPVSEVQKATGFDAGTVDQALKVLQTHPYIEGGMKRRVPQGFVFRSAGAPTADGLRAAGAWPTPESQLERVLAALTGAAEDESRPAEERGKLKQVALGLRGAAYQIALNALGGAGGNLLTP